jgi:iron complex outermembrane receptor protein
MRTGRLLRSLSVLALATAAASAAQAQTAPPDEEGTEASRAQQGQPAERQEDASGIADIIVTAQRRAESVQDVPIAISAFSAEQLERQGVTNALQISQYVPNLVAQNNTGIGSANSYYLRGLGSTETIATFDPPVGTYVDDIYLSRQNANNLSLFDVERVEVLRGPQGTLFGRNTTGGAINVILRQPGRDFGGYAEIGYGRFDKIMGRASVDLPIRDGFAIKVSGYLENDKGYVRNVTTGERLNDNDGWGARLGIRGELSPSIRWNAAYMHLVSKAENILNFDCNPAAPTQCKGRFATTGLSEKGGPPSPYAPLVISGRKANYGLGQEAVSDIVTSNFEIDLNQDTTLSFITGFVGLSQQFALDFFDGRSGPNLAFPNPPVRGFARGGFVILNDGQHEQFTQEIKLNGKLGGDLIDYVAGLYFIDERNRTDFADLFTLSPTTTLLLADRTLRNKTRAYAAYVQADLNVTDQITLTAGVRYTDEKKTFDIFDNRPVRQTVAGTSRCGTAAPAPPATLTALCLDNSNLIAPSGVRIPDEQRIKIWTPRFAVNYKPSNDLLLFASATRGFKSGGWNARGTTPRELLPFDPEKVWSYEAGIKSDLFDRRVRANLTAFYLDVSDLQTISGLVNPATGAITFLTRNFADYRNKGVELELSFVPVDNLNIFANFGYQDDEYRIDDSLPATDIYGIQSLPAQQASCRAQLAAGQIPGAPNTAPAGRPVNNAPACAAGPITASGEIATPVRTPRYTLSVGANYRIPLGSLALIPSVNASYRSKQNVATSNLTIFTGPITGSNGTFPSNPYAGDVITGGQVASNWLVNAGLALNGPDDRWTLALECQNCFDETYFQSSLSNYSYLNQPMTWMVRARHVF